MRTIVVLAALLSTLAMGAHGEALKPVGEGRLEVLFWPIYNSRLYSADGQYRERQRPLRLDIEYLRDIDADDLVAQTRSEWAHQELADERQQLWLASLGRLWPDVSKNDVLSLLVDDSEVSTFYRNGELLGSINDPDFGRSFLGIWLSPKTSRPELRLSLIGQQ